MTARIVVFEATEATSGGYIARAVGHSIFTRATIGLT